MSVLREHRPDMATMAQDTIDKCDVEKVVDEEADALSTKPKIEDDTSKLSSVYHPQEKSAFSFSFSFGS